AHVDDGLGELADVSLVVTPKGLERRLDGLLLARADRDRVGAEGVAVQSNQIVQLVDRLSHGSSSPTLAAPGAPALIRAGMLRMPQPHAPRHQRPRLKRADRAPRSAPRTCCAEQLLEGARDGPILDFHDTPG